MNEEQPGGALASLHAAGIEFAVVGGTAAVLLGVPMTTEDLDIVHRRAEDNVERLMNWLLSHDAFHRLDLARRRLPPARAALLGTGHLNLQTSLGKLDVLCELRPGEGYDEILPETVILEGKVPVRVLALPRLIEVKKAANRPKDRLALPLLIAALEEKRRT